MDSLFAIRRTICVTAMTVHDSLTRGKAQKFVMHVQSTPSQKKLMNLRMAFRRTICATATTVHDSHTRAKAQKFVKHSQQFQNILKTRRFSQPSTAQNIGYPRRHQRLSTFCITFWWQMTYYLMDSSHHSELWRRSSSQPQNELTGALQSFQIQEAAL